MIADIKKNIKQVQTELKRREIPTDKKILDRHHGLKVNKSKRVKWHPKVRVWSAEKRKKNGQKAAICIQSMVRKAQAQEKAKRRLSSLIRIQNHVRYRRAQLILQAAKEQRQAQLKSSTKIQSVVRRFLAIQLSQKRQRGIIISQAQVRKRQAQVRAQQLRVQRWREKAEAAALTIQSAVRLFQAIQQAQKRRRDIVVAQAQVRKRQAQVRAKQLQLQRQREKEEAAAVTIQSIVRRFQAIHQAQKRRRRIIIAQHQIRKKQAQSKVQVLRAQRLKEKENNAAVTIQSTVRQFQANSRYTRLRNRQKGLKRVEAATAIQAQVRRKISLNKAHSLRLRRERLQCTQNAMKIQSHMRRILAVMKVQRIQKRNEKLNAKLASAGIKKKKMKTQKAPEVLSKEYASKQQAASQSEVFTFTAEEPVAGDESVIPFGGYNEESIEIFVEESAPGDEFALMSRSESDARGGIANDQSNFSKEQSHHDYLGEMKGGNGETDHLSKLRLLPKFRARLEGFNPPQNTTSFAVVRRAC